MKIIFIVIPFITNIIYKIVGAVVNPHLMSNTLQEMAALPFSPDQHQSFHDGVRSVILARLSYVTYLSSLIGTTILSLGSAALLLFSKGTNIGGILVYLVILTFAAFVLSWVITRKASFYAISGTKQIYKKLMPTLLLCFFDVLLCVLSIWVQTHDVSASKPL